MSVRDAKLCKTCDKFRGFEIFDGNCLFCQTEVTLDEYKKDFEKLKK